MNWIDGFYPIQLGGRQGLFLKICIIEYCGFNNTFEERPDMIIVLQWRKGLHGTKKEIVLFTDDDLKLEIPITPEQETRQSMS